MAGQEIPLDAAGQEARIKELSEENELLFEQLHVVQEELEKYYLKLKECEQRKGAAAVAAPSASFDPRLPETLAENQKLRALVAQQTLALRVETQNSLPSRLGDMLIKGVSSTGAFFALPGRLRKMWKALERTTPPAELGGKSFQKVIDAYGAGGVDAVEKVLDSVFIAPTMRANAYTALARQLMPSDAKKAAAIARLAWETDPRPYRLKWLAFRMHDADDAVTAEAMLELLPADIPMSESEQRQVMRIRQDSAYLRKKKAESDAGVQKQKNAENQKIAQLTKQAEEQRREADRLRQQQKEAQKLAETRQADLKALQSRLTEQEALAANRAEEIGALKAAQAELQALADGHKAEANALQARLTEQEGLATNRKVALDGLTARYEILQKTYQEALTSVTEQQKELFSAMVSQSTLLTGGFEKQIAELERVRKSVQGACKKEIDFALQQAVAYNGLAQYFESGKLPEVTPWKRGWPASPDFILWQVELIEKNNYDLILEFGSGITSLYTAKTLAAIYKNKKSEKLTKAVTFEHLEQFFLQTKDIISQAGLSNTIDIIHAPLKEYIAPDGTAYQYYSCQETLAILSSQYRSSDLRLLVIVDGPPGATNKNARYPVFPVVMQYFAPAHIDFLLDDYIRGDEKESAGLWKAACATAGVEHAVFEKQMEKEAFLLRINPSF